MKNELKYSISKLKEAIIRLEEGLRIVKDELGEDGVIQRFEFTFELLWKTLKLFLDDRGILCKSPKDCLKAAFRYGLFSDDEIYLNMLVDRNNTTHIYNHEDSRVIYLRIKNEYANAINLLYKSIEKKIEED
ncbi:MAG: nucleotidyltransferase substrate binding protein [Melioribacteraceae bacterium]|nr:nucleotidyltransferase substrate binding protein [Melioribacteraceae bacterium]